MEDLTRIKCLLFSSCCVIRYGGKEKGTGWVAPGNKIVSAGHLFTDKQECDHINAEKINTKTITAVFSTPLEGQDCREKASIKTEYELKIICGAYIDEPLVDFCILQAEDTIEQEPLPIATNPRYDGIFLTAGYGMELKRLSNADGMISGFISGKDGKHPIKLYSKVCAQFGFSGCPIYSVASDGVIGIQARKPNRADAEKNTVFAYRLGETIRSALADPTSFRGLSAITPLDKAMDFRKEGDDFLAAGNNKGAYICYKEAEKLLYSAVGKEGAYIDDIRTRIKKCSAQR